MMLDQIDRMVRQANPVPDPSALEPVDASVLVLDVQRRTEVQPDDRVRVDRGQERPKGNLLIAIAAAAVLAIGVLALLRYTDQTPVASETPVANETSMVDEPETPVELATDFVEAYAAFDVERAASYLAADANLDGSEEDWRLGIRMWEAMGFKVLADSCEERASSASGARVRCTFDYHGIRSNQIGLGPYAGNWFDLTIREEQIVSYSMSLEYLSNGFSAQMWEPFAQWVADTYPGDAAIMFNTSLADFQLTEESIALWERRTREYVAEVAPAVGLAETFMAARNAYDAESALSLLPDDNVQVRLLNRYKLDPNMWDVDLTRDELALAFEAEQIYGVRYDPIECGLTGENLVTCTGKIDNKLRRIEGLSPAFVSFVLEIREGRIHLLSFPWLNIGFNPGGFHPAEYVSFLEWLDAEHPEAVDMDELYSPSTIFRAEGQELILLLTRESVDLLASYLDEYEASVSG